MDTNPTAKILIRAYRWWRFRVWLARLLGRPIPPEPYPPYEGD
jgi:hypothetical protein